MTSDGIKKPLKDWLNEFYDDTGKISDIVRSLGLAGIGLIWIFKNTDPALHILPKPLDTPLRFIVLGLIVDLCQYLWRAINIFIFYKIKEVKYMAGKLSNKQVEDVTIPNYVEIGTWIFFIGKIVFIAIAYFEIYRFLLDRI